MVAGQHHLQREGGEEAGAGRAVKTGGERAWEAFELRLLAVQAGQVVLAVRWMLELVSLT